MQVELINDGPVTIIDSKRLSYLVIIRFFFLFLNATKI
jgi:hypothetical protein